MEKDFYLRSIAFYFQTKQLSTSEIKELNHPFLKEIPQHLYKYRKGGEIGRKDFYINQRKIYTASFNNFPDVFEGVSRATKDRILKHDAKDLCRFYKDDIISILKNRFPSLSEDISNNVFNVILEEQFDMDNIYKRIKNVVGEKERKEFRKIVSAFAYLFNGINTKLNNNSEFAKGMDMLININDRMGAYCMCDSYSKENLWSSYGDDFKGYCVEYDLSEPCRSKGSIRFIWALYPVCYVDKKDDDWFKPLFESTISTINIDGKADQFDSALIFHHWMIKTLCSKKESRWSNEDEWRFIGGPNASQLGPLVSKVIVGHNICKNDFDSVKKYCEKNEFPMKITDIDYDKQEVIIRDITKKDIEEIEKRDLN